MRTILLLLLPFTTPYKASTQIYAPAQDDSLTVVLDTPRGIVYRIDSNEFFIVHFEEWEKNPRLQAETSV